MNKYKKEKIIFKAKEIEIIKEEDIRNGLKNLNNYIFKDKLSGQSVFIHYNYFPHVLKILNESKKTS